VKVSFHKAKMHVDPQLIRNLDHCKLAKFGVLASGEK
jgi:hypothetical protein